MNGVQHGTFSDADIIDLSVVSAGVYVVELVSKGVSLGRKKIVRL